MPILRWPRLIALLSSVCGMGGVAGSVAHALQPPMLNDEFNVRPFHGADAWVQGGFQSRGSIHESPADFGPIMGMPSRNVDGTPNSGDSFPVMQPGPLPGGFDPRGFNGSGMRPPVNQPRAIAENPFFGGSPNNIPDQANSNPWGNSLRQGTNDSQRFGNSGAGLPPRSFDGPNQFRHAGQPGTPAGYEPSGTFNASRSPSIRPQPKVSNGLTAEKSPFVGFVGQVVKPGVYEIESPTTLGALLDRMGGLANDASGQFRVIRNGRQLMTMPYAGAISFEVMAGDVVVADARPVARTQFTSSRDSAASRFDQRDSAGVQIAFVNLIDRPVVLRLRNEHSSVYSILALMRQDESLGSRIQIIAPASHRSSEPLRPDLSLPSETVLVFPEHVVRTERIASLPEPIRLNRTPQPPATMSAPSATPLASPGATPAPAARATEPSPREAVAEVPPPPVEELFSSQRRSTAATTPVAQDRIARDSNMVLAPPAESESQPHATSQSLAKPESSRDEVATSQITQGTKTAPPPDATDFTLDEERRARPSLLKPKQRRPIAQADDPNSSSDATDDELLADDLVDSKDSVANAAIDWSIWPPILTAGFGVLALFGFSRVLRSETINAASSAAAFSNPDMGHSTHSKPASLQREVASPSHATQRPSAQRTTNITKSNSALEALVHNQLPLVEEPIPMSSPLQFHGRPQPPQVLRVDQEHDIRKPHLADAVIRQSSRDRGQAVIDEQQSPREATARAAQPTSSAAKSFAKAAQQLRIDRAVATTPKAENLSAQVAPPPNLKPKTARPSTTTGTLDRALSAVQKREERTV